MDARLEGFMLRVSQSPLIDAGRQDEAIRLVLDTVCEGLRIARAGVWFFDASGAGVRCELLIDRANHTESEDTVLTDKAYPRYFAALHGERAIAAHDARSDPATSEFRDGYLVPLGVTSMLDVPIRHHGRMIGIICAEHTGPTRQWTTDEVTFAGGLADLVGRAINARAHQQAREELAALNEALEARVVARPAELAAALDTLRQTQDDLIQSEKLASLGSMVAGVAHELNTPIGNAVTVSSTLAERAAELRSLLESPSIRRSELVQGLTGVVEMAGLVDRSVNRAAALIASFKQVAMDQVSERRRSFDLREVVEENLAALRPSLRHKQVTIHNHVPAGLQCDSFPGPLGQVLTNLVQNAVLHGFAARDEGDIEVRAKSDGRMVEFVVADNGEGMDTATAVRVFEPFFTTKLGKGGSGLGLAICHRLVTTILAGDIRVVATPGAGAQFIVRFPARTPGLV